MKGPTHRIHLGWRWNAGAIAALYITCGLFFFLNWQWATALGMVVGPIVPDSWRLGFAPPIMFVGLVLIGINRVPQAVAAIVGGTVGLVAAGLQDRLGLLVGAVAGVVAGTVAEIRLERSVTPALPAIAASEVSQ